MVIEDDSVRRRTVYRWLMNPEMCSCVMYESLTNAKLPARTHARSAR